MVIENEQSDKLLEQMKQELYGVIDSYADRLSVDRLRLYINSFSLPHVVPVQTLLSRLRELKRGPYFTPEVFKQIRQETPRKMSPIFFRDLAIYERDVERYGEDSISHLGLSAGAHHTLKRSHVVTISQLRELDERELLMLRNLGPKKAYEIIKSLEKFDNLRVSYTP